MYSAGVESVHPPRRIKMPNTSSNESTKQSGQQSGQNVNQGNQGNQGGNNLPNTDNMKTGQQQSHPGTGKH
jgi:hypothetical protein